MLTTFCLAVVGLSANLTKLSEGPCIVPAASRQKRLRPPVSHPRREVFAVFSMLNSTGTLPVLEPQLLAAQGTITAGGFEYLAASPVIQSPMS